MDHISLISILELTLWCVLKSYTTKTGYQSANRSRDINLKTGKGLGVMVHRGISGMTAAAACGLMKRRQAVGEMGAAVEEGMGVQVT